MFSFVFVRFRSFAASGLARLVFANTAVREHVRERSFVGPPVANGGVGAARRTDSCCKKAAVTLCNLPRHATPILIAEIWIHALCPSLAHHPCLVPRLVVATTEPQRHLTANDYVREHAVFVRVRSFVRSKDTADLGAVFTNRPRSGTFVNVFVREAISRSHTLEEPPSHRSGRAS